MKEIVTIQIGDYANYVGSHFWNFQVSILIHFSFSQIHILFIYFFQIVTNCLKCSFIVLVLVNIFNYVVINLCSILRMSWLD
jgi:hypothetical protein